MPTSSRGGERTYSDRAGAAPTVVSLMGHVIS